MKLPNSDQAVVDIAKLRDYSLNPQHPKGKHKARVFAAVLGFATKDAENLRRMVLEAARTNEATEGVKDEHGERFTLDLETDGLFGMVMIRTAWIVDTGETIPRLVSCYVRNR
jgi:hypothetical protein